MKRVLLGGLFSVFVLLVADYTIATLQIRALILRVGSADVLRALNNLIVPGMTQPDAERMLEGFQEARISPCEGDKCLVSYRYWFGLIPPIGVPEIKLIGAIEVVYSKDGYVKESHYWIN